MTFKKGFLLFGILSLFQAGCLGFRPQKPARPDIDTREPQPTASPRSSSQALPSENLKIYLIALDDAGKSGPVIGCGDSLIAVDVQAKDMPSALQMLLDHHNRFYGQSGLYSALYQSTLTISRITTTAGKIEVDLAGNLILGGVCDNPRVEEQLKATIRQSTDKNIPVVIRVNNTPLEDLLSQK